MRRAEATIRFGNENDIIGVCELERRVWNSRGVMPLDETTIQTWLDTHNQGFLVGEYQGYVRGYAYFEHLSYNPEELDSSWPPAHAPTSTHHHDPKGSAMYGVSAAADLAGLGAQLFLKILVLGKERNKTHLATLIRMQGLARFLGELRQEHPNAKIHSNAELALWYAIHCVRTAGGDIAPHLTHATVPGFFPQHIRKDPVLTYPTHVAPMTLRGIVPSTFEDPESANLLALATFPAL